MHEKVATTDKITFCLTDYAIADEAIAPEPQFLECSWEAQGISEGWVDTYDASLPGQELDITSVLDGNYILRTVLDPDDRLRESNETNNEELVPVSIAGMSISIP
jgi:subtilase family serine protease